MVLGDTDYSDVLETLDGYFEIKNTIKNYKEYRTFVT